MRRSGWRIAVVALALSVLLHAALLGVPRWQTLPDLLGESPTLRVRLAQTPPPPVQKKPAVTRDGRAEPSRIPNPQTPPTIPVRAPIAPEAPADAVPLPTPESAPPSASDLPTPTLNRLPPRLDLRFTVHYGIASGEQTLVWVNEGERYTLTSVASAKGLTGLFYRGQFVQMSRGRMTPQGLAPEEFWDQRGDRRSSARIDTSAGQLTLSPAKDEPRHFPVQGTVQDALSLFFQLALTAPPEARFAYTVFNGKKLRDYAYEVRGEETLETALGAVRTVHVARADGDEGRFDAWLAPDHHYLPVRVLRSDEDGRSVELRIRSIVP